MNVINAFTADSLGTLLAVSGFIAPLIGSPAAAAAAVQNVLDSFGTGDPAEVVNAVLTIAPATVLDGVLNGGYGPDLGPLVAPGISVLAGGLLSSAGLVFNDDGSFYINTGGPLFSLQQVLSKIANAITPPAPVAIQTAKFDIASIPAVDAAAVTLATAGNTATETPAIDAAATDEASTEAPASNADTSAETAASSEQVAGGDTVTDAGQNTEPAQTSAAESAKDDSESISTSKGSTSTNESVQSSTGKKPTGNNVDVKTGNKVEPKATTGEHPPKSGDATAATAHEHGTTASSAGGSSKKSDAKGSNAAAKDSAA